MGSFGGHALPGGMFLIFGVWFAFKIHYRYYKALLSKQRFQSSSSFNCVCLPGRPRHWPIEGALKIFLVTVGGVIEIITAFDDTGHFAHLGNGQHATMFFFFGLNGLVDILLYLRIGLPHGLDYITSFMAFLVEYILFSFHLQGRPKVDVLLHTLLLYIIIATCAVILLEMYYRENVIIALARSFLLLVQGTWFWQVGFILYNPVPNPAKWDLDDHHSMTIVTIYFAWHVAVNFLILFLIGFAVKVTITGTCGRSAELYMETDLPVVTKTKFNGDTKGQFSLLRESDSDNELYDSLPLVKTQPQIQITETELNGKIAEQ